MNFYLLPKILSAQSVCVFNAWEDVIDPAKIHHWFPFLPLKMRHTKLYMPKNMVATDQRWRLTYICINVTNASRVDVSHFHRCNKYHGDRKNKYQRIIQTTPCYQFEWLEIDCFNIVRIDKQQQQNASHNRALHWLYCFVNCAYAWRPFDFRVHNL